MPNPPLIRYLNFFSDALSFLKTVTWHKILNSVNLTLSYLLSNLTKNPTVNGLPTTVTIEPTTLCNLTCPECPSGNGQLRRRKGNMEMVVYDSILNQIEKTTLWLLLYFQGEPFLHPELFSMIKKAHQNNLYTILSTNGHFLDEKNSKKIIKTGLNRIVISLDGANEETYNKYRKNGNFDKVLEGTKTLTRMKKMMKSHKPIVIIQFLVFRYNQEQIKSIRSLGKQAGADKVQIKSAQIYNPNQKSDIVPTNPKYARYRKNNKNEIELKTKLNNKCSRLWFTTVVSVDGDIAPCCFDKNLDHPMGNIKQNSLKSIWKNASYKQFRQQILNNRKSVSICRNCTE